MTSSRRCRLPNRLHGWWRQGALVLACVALVAGFANPSTAQDDLPGKRGRQFIFSGVPRNLVLLDLPDVRYPELGVSFPDLDRRRIGPIRLLWGNGGAIQVGAGYEVQVDRLDWRKNGRSRVTIAPAKGTDMIGWIHPKVITCRLLTYGAAGTGLIHPVLRVPFWYEALTSFGVKESVTLELPAGIEPDLGAKAFYRSSTEQFWWSSGPLQWRWGNGYAIQVGEGYDIEQDLLDFRRHGRAQIILSLKRKQNLLYGNVL